MWIKFYPWRNAFHLLLFLLISGCGPSELSPEDEVKAFQEELNAYFSDEEESPLTADDRAGFEGLEFFPVDTSFRVRARLEFHPESEPFLMKTTTDRLPVYKLYATAHFRLKGRECSLEIYQNQDLIGNPEFSDYLFLPFTDRTNGNSSYGGGRYLDLSMPEDDQLTIDFNKSYNPYCAYNSEYSCPVPPEVNDLDLKVTAGVMAYGHH